MVDAPVIKNSISVFPGDGVTTVREINFAGGYISQAHVKSIVMNADNRLVESVLSFIGPNTVSVIPAAVVGGTCTVYRDTPKDLPLASFSDKAILTSANLDLIAKQSVFIAAEAQDYGIRGEPGPGLTAADMEVLDGKVAGAAGSASAAAASAAAAITEGAAKVALAAAQAAAAAGSAAASAGSVTSAQVAAAAAQAAKDSTLATLGAAAEVAVTEAAGINLNVDYSGQADGTAGDVVGTPPMVASGKAFTVAGGFAVSAAEATAAAPAFLRHTPNYALAVQTTTITPASGQSAAVAQNTGPLMYYTDAANFGFWGVNKDSGLVYFRRVTAGVSSSAVTFTTGAGALTSWTLETTSSGKRTFNVTLIRPDGARYGPYTYTATSDLTPAWGIAAIGPALRVQSVKLSTNRSQIARRLSDVEAREVSDAAKYDPNFPRRIQGERDSKWAVSPARGGVFDIKGSATEYILMDDFMDADGTAVGVGGAHVPDHMAANLPSGYATWGATSWQVLGGKLTFVAPASQAQRDPGLLVSAIAWPVSRTWLDTNKGLELSFELSSTRALDGEMGAFFKTENGAFLVSITQGGLRILYRNDAGGGATLADNYPAVGTFPTTAGNSVRCTIRVYEGNGFIAQIGSTTAAWGFMGETGLGRSYPKITHAGVYSDPRFNGLASFGFDQLRLGPVPAVGGSRYRTLPAMPPPIAPKFVKRGVQWTIAQADTGYGQYNFQPINMAAIAAKLGITPIDNYYCYGSTDHGTGAAADGGIFLYTASSLLGPWTRRGAAGYAGRIYSDGTNLQCETPVVVYDPVKNRLLMFYQVYKVGGVNVQETRVAWSADGQNWTKIRAIYPFSETALVPDHVRHSGYFAPFKDPLGVVPGWIGFGRMYPGTTSSVTGVSRSADGETWDIDLLPTYFPFLQAHYEDKRVIHNHGYATAPFAYQGQRLIIVAPFRPNESGASTGYLALTQLGDDMRNMSAQEVIPFPMTEPDEIVGSQVIAGVLVENGTLYVWYQANNKSIWLATADLTKGPDGLARQFGI